MVEHIERGSAMRTAHILRPEDKELMSAISIIPAADVVPVRRGRWTMSSDRPDTIICSCCDNAFDVWKADIKRHNYSPNCGARMDLEEDTYEM